MNPHTTLTMLEYYGHSGLIISRVLTGVFDTNACPSANGLRFSTRAEIICQNRGQVCPDGRPLYLIDYKIYLDLLYIK